MAAAVGLGSNLGDRRAYLTMAVAGLPSLGELRAVSSLYETAPVGGPAQGPYLNAVAILDTPLPPRDLLVALLDLEAAAGRKRRIRFGPRTLDCDILLYGDRTIDEKGLQVPHPRLTERRFALEPLLEVRPDAQLPGGQRLQPLLAATAEQETRVVAGPGWPAPV